MHSLRTRTALAFFSGAVVLATVPALAASYGYGYAFWKAPARCTNLVKCPAGSRVLCAGSMNVCVRNRESSGSPMKPPAQRSSRTGLQAAKKPLPVPPCEPRTCEEGLLSICVNGKPTACLPMLIPSSSAASSSSGSILSSASSASSIAAGSAFSSSAVLFGSASSAAVTQVSIMNLAFVPSPITVKAGTTVKWTNKDVMPHTVTGTAFDSGTLNPGQTFSFTFSSPGTFPYTCNFHASMTASITVIP